MGMFGNGNTQPKAAPVISMSPRPAPRREAGLPGRELGEDAAHIWQDIRTLTAERNALLDDVAKLQVVLHQARDETATVRKVLGDHIAKLEHDNQAQRETIDRLADRLAGLVSKLHLLGDVALRIVSEEAPATPKPQRDAPAQSGADAPQPPAAAAGSAAQSSSEEASA
jgi:hypothetical protein